MKNEMNKTADNGISAASSGPSRTAGQFESLKQLGRTAIDILHTRFDLLATEIAEEQARLARLLLYAAVSLLCLFLALVIVAVFVVVMLWDTQYRMLAMGLIAAALAIGGIGCGIACVREARAKPKLFSSSLDEIGADLERLK